MRVKLESLSKSKQELFDIVTKHVFAQGKPAVNKLGSCSYRGENNTSCAMGCLITDEEYAELNNKENLPDERESLEGLASHTLFKYYLVKPEDESKMDLIQSMQQSHDSMEAFGMKYKSDKEKLEVFKSNMLITAREFKLNADTLEGLASHTLFKYYLVKPEDESKMDLIQSMQQAPDSMEAFEIKYKSNKEKLEVFKSNMLITAREFKLNADTLEGN